MPSMPSFPVNSSVLCHKCQSLVRLYMYGGADCYTCSNCGNEHAFVSYNQFLECVQMVKIAEAKIAEQNKEELESLDKLWAIE